MPESVFTVRFISKNDCFAYISPSALHKLDVYLKVTFNEKCVFLSALASPTLSDKNTIGLSSVYAQTLGINDGDNVVVQVIEDLPIISKLTVIPINQDDYEIIEAFSDNIQSSLLNQISVINAKEYIVIWIGSNISVTVFVDKVLPEAPGTLYNLTELVIEVPSKLNNLKNTTDINKSVSESTFTSERAWKFKISDFRKPQLIFQCVPLKDIKCFEKISHYILPFTVFTSKKYIMRVWGTIDTKNAPIVCRATLLSVDQTQSKSIYARLYCFEEFISELNEKFRFPRVYVDDLTLSAICGRISSRISLEIVKKQTHVSELHILPLEKSKFNLEEFRMYLADNCPKKLILNSDVLIEFNDNLKCSLKFLPKVDYCVVDETFVKNCKYLLSEEAAKSYKHDVEESVVDYTTNFSNIGEIIENILSNCKRNEFDYLENVLLIGKVGTGKTHTLKIIKNKLIKSPHYIYSEFISCASIKGKTVDSLHKILMTSLSELILHQPSCLILDDLEILCENVTDENISQNSVYFNRVSEMMQAFLHLIKNNDIVIIASIESIHKINKLIYSTRGEILFKNVYELKDLEAIDRANLLEYFLSKYELYNIDFVDLSSKTEGFVVQDLSNLAEKIIFEAYKDAIDKEVIITSQHCEKALKTANILSLQNVQLYSAGNIDFCSIGGLNNVKQMLMESLLWPTKYASLFSGAPLRLQSGLLLYGPPGTGKTLLVGAAASHCHLRLISIKGPELLSKYIGASEQAVRDTFQKAQNARPCILFFDEFDSLAPRRGHDNTGVTDRVVNQLLTQLDGVESLQGVCVVAATSRPDLLDPALLRPGRLDRQAYCPLPDLESRKEILEILTKNLTLENCDLWKIAKETEGYSGADLQSILCTAQMDSVCFVEDQKRMELEAVNQGHLEQALLKTRPSLSIQELMKYERIYKKFQGGKLEDFSTGSRATLA